MGVVVLLVEALERDTPRAKRLWGFWGGGIFSVGMLLFFLGLGIVSSAAFRDFDYRALIGDVHEAVFSTNTQPLDPASMATMVEATGTPA